MEINAINASIDAKRKELDEIRRQLADIRNRIEGKRQQIQALREEIRRINERRGALVSRLRDLKQRRITISNDIQQLRRRISNYKSIQKMVNESTGGKPMDKERLKYHIEQLEFSYETSPSDPQRDREFIRAIARLEREVNAAEILEKITHKISESQQRIQELKKEREDLKNDIQKVVEELIKLKDVVNEAKKKLEIYINELKALKDERDILKQRRDEIKRTILELISRRKELRKKAGEIRSEINKYNLLLKALEMSERASVEKSRDQLAREMLMRRAEEIYERFKKGERLSFEEIQVLYEAGILKEGE